MSDMAEGVQTAPEAPQETQAAEAPQNDALMARLDEMAQQIGKLAPPEKPVPNGLREAFAEGAPAPEAEQFDPYGEQDPYQGQEFDPYQQQYQDPYAQQQMNPAQAAQQLQQYIQQAVQQATLPITQGIKADQLEQKYPAIKEDPQKWLGVASDQARRIGRPDLAQEPEFIELVYLAELARNSAAQETPADGGNGVHLEGGGAAPQQPEEDAGDRMLKAWGLDPNAM